MTASTSTAATDRARWIALVVLCVGMLGLGYPHAAALTDGYHLAWVISAGIALVALGVAATVIQAVQLGEAPVSSIADELIEDERTTYAEAA